MQVSIREAEDRLSELLDLVEAGEIVAICRDGNAVAELVPVRKSAGFPFGIGRGHAIGPEGDDWWQSMTDEEADDWCEGR